jgi:2-polyprenyl-3-methyl-5-hydroxy-6-metoxy-1,4-benzoquinol methylase
MDKYQIIVDTFDRRAQQYQDKYMDISLYSQTFDAFCQLISQPNADILELACGPGNVTQYLLSQRPDFNILATDLAPAMLELGKTNNPQATFELMDCRDIGKLTQKFDAIMCGFCLPYLSKEEVITLINDAKHLLKPGGVIYLSTMEDSYDKSCLQTGSNGDQMYTHYHPAQNLTDPLTANGFEIVQLLRQRYPEQSDDAPTDLIVIARI